MIWTRSVARVATIHDLAPCAMSKKYNWPRMFYARVVARMLAWRQDGVIAVSRQTERDIAAYFGLRGARVACVPNGIDHERFHVTSTEREPFLLYVARLEHPAKNHCRLIAAFDRFKAETKSDWKLVLAGSDWQDAGAIHAAARRAKFAADIRFLVSCPRKRSPAFTKKRQFSFTPRYTRASVFRRWKRWPAGAP